MILDSGKCLMFGWEARERRPAPGFWQEPDECVVIAPGVIELEPETSVWMERAWGRVTPLRIIPSLPIENRLRTVMFSHNKGLAAARDILGDIRELQVQIEDAQSVRHYLSEHSDMRRLVLSVCESIRAELGAGQLQVVLTLAHDPESSFEYLAVYARCATYDESFMNKLDRVASQFENEVGACSGELVISTDFRLL